MRCVIRSAFMTALLIASFPPDSHACGESMFRIGKGVQYRAFSAPIPGTVLVYARTEQERAVAEQLRQAGHQVLIVSDDVDLAIQLEQQPFDVIVAPASKREAVESGASTLASPPGWVPVFQAGTGEAKALRPTLGRGVSSDDDVRKYLKEIHRRINSQKN